MPECGYTKEEIVRAFEVIDGICNYQKICTTENDNINEIGTNLEILDKLKMIMEV